MPTYTYEEVMEHNRNGSCWLVIRGNVYDVTSFNDHPGGYQKLMSARGTDATDGFDRVGEHHDEPRVQEMMRKYKVGDIDLSTVPVRRTYRNRTISVLQEAGNSASTSRGRSHTPGNNPREYTPVEIIVFLLFLALIFNQLFGNKKK